MFVPLFVGSNFDLSMAVLLIGSLCLFVLVSVSVLFSHFMCLDVIELSGESCPFGLPY